MDTVQANCAAQAVYAEARSESERGQRAVLHVILNRKKSGRFPNTICGVVKQRGQFVYRNGSGPTWKRIKNLILHPGSDPTNGALFFKSKRSKARWNKTFLTSIGGHLFYK